MLLSVFVAISSFVAACGNILYDDCPLNPLDMLAAEGSIGGENHNPRLNLNLYSSGFERPEGNGISTYSVINNLGVQILFSNVGAPENISFDLISTNLISFAVSWIAKPIENPMPYLIFPFLVGGETGIKYRSVSLGLQTRVHPYFRRGLSYQSGPVLSLSISHIRLSVHNSFELNDFRNSSFRYDQNQIGIAAGISN